MTNSCGANQAQDFFDVINSTATGVKLSDITIKYWINDTSGQTVVPHISTGGCLTNAGGCFHQVSGVTATAVAFGPACGSDPTHQANWEITISNTDSTVVAPGVSWTNIQSALNLANYSNFSPGTATWFSPCLTGTSYAPDSHFAVYTQGNLVFSSGIPTPACRSPQGKQQLQGQITPDMAAAPLVGPLPPSTILSLSIQLPTPAPQMQALLTAAAQVSDPNSSTYQQYLTVAQIAGLYGPSQSDYNNLTAFAQSKGLTVTGSFTSRLALGVSGTASAIEQAFYVNLNNYLRPDGTQFYGPDREPSVDFSTTLGHISGLDNFRVSIPLGGSGPQGSFLGKDFRNAYASCTTMTGTGQTIGIYTEQGFNAPDIEGYEDAAGIAHVPVSFQSVDKFPNGISPTRGSEEISADIELAIAMAPGLSQVVVFGGNDGNDNVPNPEDTLLAMLDSNVAINQFTASWTFLLSNVDMIPWFALAGKSFFTGSGDSGSFNPLGPGYTDIRELPYVTVVGGTSLTMSGNGSSYGSETVWNEAKEADPGGASGGGYVNLLTPAYQKAVNTNAQRSIPDLSMVAAQTSSVAQSEAEFSTKTTSKVQSAGFEGTSESSPLMAAFVALTNQQRAQNGLPPLGFINPAIYAIGLTPSVYATSFNDIADGSNNAFPFVASPGPSFTAIAGYDLASGWGTPKCNLINQLAGPTPTGPLAVTAGKIHACAVRPGGVVECWGDNSAGQLGNGTNNGSPKPVVVSSLSGVTQIAAGAMHTCALVNGTVSCWGFNGEGELGNGATANSNVPVVVSGLSGVTAIAAGGQHSCAILSDRIGQVLGAQQLVAARGFVPDHRPREALDLQSGRAGPRQRLQLCAGLGRYGLLLGRRRVRSAREWHRDLHQQLNPGPGQDPHGYRLHHRGEHPRLRHPEQRGERPLLGRQHVRAARRRQERQHRAEPADPHGDGLPGAGLESQTPTRSSWSRSRASRA